MGAKVKRYSLAYWVKKSFDAWDGVKIYTAAIEQYTNGGIPDLDYDGTAQELAFDLWVEWHKRGKVYGGQFFTPLRVAEQMAEWLGVWEGRRVLDPCAGTGNLLHAAAALGAEAFGYELGYDLAKVCNTLGKADPERPFTVEGCDPLDTSFDIAQRADLAKVDGILINPPFGKIGGYSDIAVKFMEWCAQLAVPTVALLPNGWWDKTGKTYRAVQDKFSVGAREDLPLDTFKPLTGVATELLYLMPVVGRVRAPEPAPMEPQPARVMIEDAADHLWQQAALF